MLAVRALRRLGFVVCVMGAMLTAGCGGSGRSGGPLPATGQAQIPTATSRNPASVPVPPMQGLTGSRPAMSLQKPQSEINALNFTQLPGAAVWVAASPDGTFWVLSTQGLPSGDKFIYHYVNGAFVNVPGAATRIAVGPDNTPWVLNSAGGIYHLVNGVFTGIAGGASELSVGGTTAAVVVDVISNQSPGPYGAGIYQYSPATNTWTQLPGAGVTVAASIDSGTYSALNITPGGFYVTNQVGGIYYYNPGQGFEQLPGGAIRLAPTASGGLFALGNPGAYQHGIYYNDLSTGTWTQMPGAAVSISANSSNFYAIGAAGGIYVSPITTVAATGNGAPLTGPKLGYTTGNYVGGWGPTDLANDLQYPVQSGFNGSGTTVAIVVDGVFNQSDLATYTTWFQTPQTGRSVTVQYPVVDSQATLQSDYINEAALDVQTVAGLAPGANIILYAIPSLSDQYENDAYNAIISSRSATIVSSSFSGCEAPLEVTNGSDSVQSAIFANGSSAGIAFVAASGDQGTACSDGTDKSGGNLYLAGVGYPASDPNVIGVGGNETYPTNNGIQLTNPVVWNDDDTSDNSYEASGGGVSTEFTIPSYQVGVAGEASSRYRNVPDVALPASYSATVINGTWTVQGGTSWGSPAFAAMLAEVEEYCNAPLTDAAADAYTVFSSAGYTAFINVTSGNNGFSLQSLATPTYYASGGYSNATGIGIPLGMPFAKTLCPNRVLASTARSATAATVAATLRPAQAYTTDVRPGILGLVDQGRKPASEPMRIQVGIIAGGSAAAGEAAVEAALQSAGLTVVQTFSNHLLVDATGPTSAVEAFFATQMHNERQAQSTVYLPGAPITVPASIAPYASGIILDNVVNRFHPEGARRLSTRTTATISR